MSELSWLHVVLCKDTMRAYIQQLRQEMGVRTCDKVFDPETDKPSKVICTNMSLLFKKYKPLFSLYSSRKMICDWYIACTYGIHGDQEKIPQHKNDDIFVAEEYFYIRFFLFIQHIFLNVSTWFCSIFLTFIRVMQHQSQNYTFTDQQLNVSNFA